MNSMHLRIILPICAHVRSCITYCNIVRSRCRLNPFEAALCTQVVMIATGQYVTQEAEGTGT